MSQGMREDDSSGAGRGATPRCVVLVGEADAVPANLVGALDRRGLDIVIVRQPPRVMAELAEASRPTAAARRDRDGVWRADDDMAESHHEQGPNPSESGGDFGAGDGVADGAGQRDMSEARSPPPPGLSVVIVEPQQQPRIGELRQAVASYYPAVRCWQYQAHGPEGHASLETYPAPGNPTAIGAHHDKPDSEAVAEATVARPGQDFLDPNPDPGHTSRADETTSAQRLEASRQGIRSLVTLVPTPREPDNGPLVTEQELAMLLGPIPTPGTDPETRSESNASHDPKPSTSHAPPRPT